MKKTIIITIMLFVAFANLQAQEKTKKSPKKEMAPQKEKYALEIAFISIGSGIDGVSYDRIDSLIKNHPKKLAVKIVQKGREGERFMYLKLRELSKKEKHEFINEVEKLIVNKNLVQIQKNFELETIETR